MLMLVNFFKFVCFEVKSTRNSLGGFKLSLVFS